MSLKPLFLRLDPRVLGDEPIVLPEEQDHAHPERYYKDLLWVEDGERTDEQKALLKTPAAPDQPFKNFALTPVELCRNCGWHSRWETSTGYASRVKVFHARHGMAIWSIGSKWLLRDQPNDCYMGNDYITQTFLRQQPNMTIPLVEEMRLLSEPTDRNHYTLMSRAQGVPLTNVWGGLSDGQKDRIKDQLIDVLRQLRRFTAPSAQNVDGGPMRDGILGSDSNIPPTVDEWFDNAAETLRAGLSYLYQTQDANLINQYLQMLKEGFPKCEPYVLTHSDLHFSNIIVNEDGIVAILDWEHSGYLPWWVERMRSLTSFDAEGRKLFKEIWQEINPEMDHETFFRDIVPYVMQVQDVWKNAPVKIDGLYDSWYRRAWCECKPVGGKFSRRDMGCQPQRTLIHEPLETKDVDGNSNHSNSETKSSAN